jgi:hypothetical protein
MEAVCSYEMLGCLLITLGSLPEDLTPLTTVWTEYPVQEEALHASDIPLNLFWTEFIDYVIYIWISYKIVNRNLLHNHLFIIVIVIIIAPVLFLLLYLFICLFRYLGWG